MGLNTLWLVGGTATDGAAGLAIDLVTANSLGASAQILVTAITAQDYGRVDAIAQTSARMVCAQANVLRRGPTPGAIKSGMIGDFATAKEIGLLVRGTRAPYVCDPVMAAGSGTRLCENDHAIWRLLFRHARLITPNLPEAEALLGIRIDDIAQAARALLKWGPQEVLIKGGHSRTNACDDYWTNGMQSLWLRAPRRQIGRAHGTGCTLATAIATGLAQGMGSEAALTRAKALIERTLGA